jgi:hypothetical protein
MPARVETESGSDHFGAYVDVLCNRREKKKVEALKKKVSEPIVKALSTLDTPPLRNNFTAWAAKNQIFYDNQQGYEHNHQL